MPRSLKGEGNWGAMASSFQMELKIHAKPWKQMRTWAVDRNVGWLSPCQSSSGKALGAWKKGLKRFSRCQVWDFMCHGKRLYFRSHSGCRVKICSKETRLRHD